MKKIFCFLSISFFWSWIFWIVALSTISEVLNQETFGNFLILFFIGIYGPSVGSLLTSLIWGKSEFLTLIKNFLNFNVPIITIVLTFSLPIFFVATGVLIYAIIEGNIGPIDIKGLLTVPSLLMAGIYAGPLGEELGWRGLLLPELQKKISPLKSAIIVGIIWFSWHIPLFWSPIGTLVSGHFSLLSLVTYFLMIICLSIIVTWLFNQSFGNIWIGILFHLFINAGLFLTIFPELTSVTNKIHLYSSVSMIAFTIYLILSNKIR